jgi:hypothetical protein
LLDAGNEASLQAHLLAHPADAIISGLPFYCNPGVARAARAANAHYFDLTEDVAVTRAVREIADGAATAFVPQCGLAPGFISIAAAELLRHFDEVRSVKLRVGALPQHPNNVLKYSLTWSTEGLINEYGNPCEAIVDGQLSAVQPLEGLEEIEIDGTLYEGGQTIDGYPAPLDVLPIFVRAGAIADVCTKRRSARDSQVGPFCDDRMPAGGRTGRMLVPLMQTAGVGCCVVT